MHFIQVLIGFLAYDIEAPYRIYIVPEKFDPDRSVVGQREDIENSAPDCKLPRCIDLRHIIVAQVHKPPLERRKISLLTVFYRDKGIRKLAGFRQLIHQGIDRRYDSDLVFFL